MSLGLTTEGLTSVFFQQMFARGNEFEGQLQAVTSSENPQLANQIKELNKKFPQLDLGQFFAIMTIFVAFMDVIVANNEALAKVIPHIET